MTSPTLSSRLAGKRVVTVDLDATLYDPWACCGTRGKGYGSDADCTHARVDTLQAIHDVCVYYDAVPVILSWRGGLVATSKKWLADIGFEYHAMFIPGSADDNALGRPQAKGKKGKPTGGYGQVGFKLGTVQQLEAQLGVGVVASFDDNKQVIDALTEHGVLEPRQVPHLVTIERHEWNAGYLGAPKPKKGATFNSWKGSSYTQSTLTAALSTCDLCGESLAAVPSDVDGICGWCLQNGHADDLLIDEPEDAYRSIHDVPLGQPLVDALDSDVDVMADSYVGQVVLVEVDGVLFSGTVEDEDDDGTFLIRSNDEYLWLDEDCLATF